MEAKEAQEMAETTWAIEEQEVVHYGARTIPSQPIQRVDRSERIGEDTALTDRVHAVLHRKVWTKMPRKFSRTLSSINAKPNERR